MPKLTIIRGLPGSGKSTLAKTKECFHVEADMFHIWDGNYNFHADRVPQAHELCKKLAFDVMEKGNDVVVSNTFTRIAEMEPYIDFARLTGHFVEVIHCNASFGSVHNVPEEVMTKMKERWEKYPREIILSIDKIP